MSINCFLIKTKTIKTNTMNTLLFILAISSIIFCLSAISRIYNIKLDIYAILFLFIGILSFVGLFVGIYNL